MLQVATICVMASCTPDEIKSSIPYAPVNFKVDVVADKIDYFDFAVFERPRLAGEYVGYAGLLIFRDHEGVLFAFDLCCPYEKNRDIKVRPNSSGEAICPVCHTTYDIMHQGQGFVKTGPGKMRLQRYSVLKIYEDAYRITN